MVNRIIGMALTLLMAFSAAAQNNVQRYVDSTMRATPLLKNAAVAILALDGRGKTIAAYNPDLPLLSASTMKTITTGVALDALGPDFRFETKVAVAGETDECGILHGDIYIIGGGDPTLGSHGILGQDINTIFAEWAEAIKARGITAIDGKIIGDTGFFKGEMTHGSWCWEDLGTYYGSAPCGLSFAENLSYFSVTPGEAEGDTLHITPVEDVYSEMDIRYDATTGAPKTGNKLIYYASDLSPVGRYTGTFACDRKADTIAVSNRFPALTCAEAFAGFLAGDGITAPCDATDSTSVSEVSHILRTGVGAAPDTAVLLTVTKSPTLLEICRETNTKSNNFFAETLFMTLGLHLTGETSYDTTPAAIEQYISDMGCNTTGLRQDDGSGLSRMNYVTPRFFCKFYRMMQKRDIFARYYSTFPTPGEDGTLKYVLSKEPAKLRSRIHCKSGSMTGVKCYAGYVETVKGEQLCFAIMVNNYDCPTSRIQTQIEGFLKQLALYERK